MDKFPRFTLLKTVSRKLTRDYRLYRGHHPLHSQSATLTDQHTALLDTYESMLTRAHRLSEGKITDLYSDLGDIVGVRPDIVQAYFTPLIEEIESEAKGRKRRPGDELVESITKMIKCELASCTRTYTEPELDLAAADEATALAAARPIPVYDPKPTYQEAEITTPDGYFVPIRYCNTEDDESFPTNWEFLFANKSAFAPAIPDRTCCKCTNQSSCKDSRLCTCVPQRADTGVYIGSGASKKLAKIPKSTIFECRRDCACLKEKCSLSFFTQNSERTFARDLVVWRTVKNGDFFWSLRTVSVIEKLEFVLEVTGEVIPDSDTAEFLAVKLHPSFVLDTSRSGSLARFIAHSCSANLAVVKVIEKSRPRITLFSNREIKAGEELTVNFGVMMNVKSKLKCDCGGEECKGFIGGS